MKKTLVIALLAVLALGALLYAVVPAYELLNFSGIFHKDGDRYLLECGPNSKQLLLAPQAVLDSLWLPADGDSLNVIGVDRQGAILVVQYGYAEHSQSLRSYTLEPLYTGLSTYTVNRPGCIGCRLCENNCPVDAITMQGRKAVIDQSKCVECGICKTGNGRFRGCPVGAITK